ncbi:hypothetical protein T4C_3519 [Trichinella pseudospiralis]|uniref:Uncharacterized protein n=1 Tax=Trichinella pseudospiralis TaxID=6337 RepID=A0A0V1IDH9_TRIPS|nr:hypothetical protein T4C_3519 [Trichinella pseudospiralis]
MSKIKPKPKKRMKIYAKQLSEMQGNRIKEMQKPIIYPKTKLKSRFHIECNLTNATQSAIKTKHTMHSTAMKLPCFTNAHARHVNQANTRSDKANADETS